MVIKIKIVGVGGAGVNSINRLAGKKLSGVSLAAVNTDKQSLQNFSSGEKIQIGRELTKGHGSGGNSEIGRMSANESRNDLARAVEGAELVIISAGLGGGTGGGASPVIAKLAKEAGVTVLAVVTMPFFFEGQKRMDNATEGLSFLENDADTVLVIPNNKLFGTNSGDISLPEVFEKSDNLLISVIKSITDLIVKPGLINLDFSNLRTVLSKGGRGFFGFGTASGENRIKEIVEKTFSSDLLEEADVKTAGACLINIYGPAQLSLKEVDSIMETVSERLNKSANIVFGVTIDRNLRDEVRMMAICTGLKECDPGLSAEKDEKKWPAVFDYKDEMDIPSFLRKK